MALSATVVRPLANSHAKQKKKKKKKKKEKRKRKKKRIESRGPFFSFRNGRIIFHPRSVQAASHGSIKDRGYCSRTKKRNTHTHTKNTPTNRRRKRKKGTNRPADRKESQMPAEDDQSRRQSLDAVLIHHGIIRGPLQSVH